MKFIPMRAHESRVYFPNMAGGFDLYSVFVRRNTVKEVHDADQATAAECAAFIVKACNHHEQLATAAKGSHRAMDWLMARLIELDPTFMPTKSPVWPAILANKKAIDATGDV